MRKYRAKKKAAAAATPQGLLTHVTSSETPRTRSMDQRREKKQAYWRRKKQEQRAKMSSQSKRRVREKDRLHKREMRAKAKSPMAKMLQTPTTSAEQGAFESESAKSKAIYRARNKLPRSSEKYAAVVAGLISTKSPRKKAALSRQGITCAEADQKLLKCVRKTCQSLKSGRRRQFVGELTRHLDGKHGLKNFASQNLGIKYKYLMKYRKLRLAKRDLEKRQVRSDNISESLRKAVEEHYEKPHISTVMPNKKGIGANASKPKHVLQRSLSESYKAFCQENRDKKIGRAKFAQIRPKHVLLQSKSKLYQCLCESCANADLMLRALQLNAIKAKSSCRVGDRYQMSDLTLCKTEGMYRNLPCIDRQCDICGVHLLDEMYEPLLNGRANEEVCWQQWGKITYGDGKKRVALQRITGTLSNLIEQLKGHMEKFPCHLFQARWQQGQYYSLCKNPPEKSIVIVMDFAENYSCAMQHEVQSAHWFIAQVTLHPMVANYQCECGQPSPVREAIHIITDDMKHDSHAVYKFVSTAVDHLTKVRGLSPQRLIQFSDGCSGQYKSKIPFMDVSCGNKDLGIPQVERHYFGSSHGKNPCDGEGGVVKNAAARAVQSEPDVVISDAMSFFRFCSERLTKEAVDADGRCNHSRRVFFYIPTDDIKRSRPSRLDICGLPGTRQIHSVCGVGPKQLKVRRLSCFCQGCNSGGECLNSAYVDKWTAKTLKTKRIQDDPVPDDPVADGQDTDDDDDDGADDPVATDPTTDTETTDKDGPVVDDPGTSGSIGNAPHGDAVCQDVSDVPPLQFQDLDISEIFKVMMRDEPIICPVNESTSDTHPSRADPSLNSADSAASTISTNVTQELNGSEHQSTPADIAELPGSINLEEYYAVYYDRDYYIGRAIARDGDNFKFKFMHRHLHYSGANYDWPRRPDIEWIHKRYIIDGPLKLVSLNGLECLIWMVDRMQDKFKVYISTALPPAVERLGDSKEQVRESAQNFIQKLMSYAATPQYIFERLMKAFSHKAWRVREEILLCLINTINVHGASTLTLSKIVPSICKLLGDPNSQVRDTAINTLVEIYRHVGEKVRIDLGKKGIPSSRLSIIYAKFDDVKKSGKMLVPTEQLTQRSSGGNAGGGDETDNKTFLWESAVKRSNKSQIVLKPHPKTAKKPQARRVSANTQPRKITGSSSAPASRPTTGSSSQTLVDKDTFLAAFEDVDTVNVYSAKSLQDELNTIYQTTNDEKQDWEARTGALKRLRSLVNNGAQEYECFLPLLRLMEDALILSAKDLRSQVVREACITLAHLSCRLGRQFDHAAESVLPTLFQLIPNSAKVMSNCGCVCLEFILTNTHNPRLIPIVKSHITSKSTAIRKQTFYFINIIVSTWPPHLLEKHVGLFVEALHKGMEDADSEARSFSRKAFWKFSENFKSQADKLFNILEPNKQKMLNGELSGASSTSSLDSNRSYRKLSAAGSHENLSSGSSKMSLPKRSTTAKPRTSEIDGPVTLGKRSSSEVNLAAVDRARTRYAAAKSPTSTKPASRLARSKSTSRDSLATPVRREPQRTPNGRSGRPRNKFVSQSTPGSKTNSRSSSPSTTRLPNIVTNGSLGRQRRKSGIPVRSQGASREASRESSPNRYGPPSRERRSSGGNVLPQREHLSRKQLLAQKTLGTGKDVEAALADVLTSARLQSRYDSDEESDASSVCSAGSHGASPRIPEDMVEILAKMASPAWSERKEGLLGLQNALLLYKQLTRSEIKRVTELFTRMFVDPHSKTFSLFLETLGEFVLAYNEHINDWLFILMTRLLQKMGSDLLPSLIYRIEKTIDIVREHFPYESQFRILMKYIVDQTQTPNSKVKVAMLRYLETLSDVMEPSGFQNSSETRLAVSRIISWIKEDKSMDVRRSSSSVLIALFELNTSEFSAMLAFFPRSYQDTATKLLQNHLQKASNHSEITANDVRQKASPRANYRSPRGQMSPRGAAEPVNGSNQNLDEMDSDEIMKSLRQTTAEIQSFMSNSRDDLDKINKVTSPRMDSDQVSADSGLTTSMPDIRVDSPEGKGLSEGITKLKLEGSSFEDEQFHEGDDDPGQFQPLLTVLSNHSAKFEERKTAMATLIRLSHAGHMPSWEANFRTVLYLLLETLTDIEPSIRALALKVLREILRNQPERFKEYAELTILKILEAHKDVIDVARTAEETSVVLASNIPPEQSIKVLCPIIQTAEVPVNQAAIKMLTKVIEVMAYPEVKTVLSDIVPVLVKAYDNTDSSVRKASVFCLVAIHSVVGDEIKEFLDDLSGSKMKLLNLYIKRAQSEKLSQGSSPSPSSPTSLSTGSR